MTIDPKKSESNLKWYIVHTYSGFEHKVKTTLKGKEKNLFKEVLSRIHHGPNGCDGRDLAHRQKHR